MDTIQLYEKILKLTEQKKSKVADFIDSIESKPEEKTVKNKAKFGSGKNIFVMMANFEDPIEDFIDYMN